MTAVFLLCTIILFVLQTLSMKLQHAEHLPQKLLVNCAFSLLAAAAMGAGRLAVPDMFTVSPATLRHGIAFGVLFALTILFYNLAIASGPLSYTTFYFSASMLVPAFAGVLLFGPWLGFVYNYVGICLGSIAAFLLAKLAVEFYAPVRAGQCVTLATRPSAPQRAVYGRYTTLCAQDGTVLYDNRTNASEMENHAVRPEIAAAEKNGTGEDNRLSETFAKQTFYYAVRLKNGDVLRISATADSVFGALSSASPWIVLIILLALLVAALLAGWLTEKGSVMVLSSWIYGIPLWRVSELLARVHGGGDPTAPWFTPIYILGTLAGCFVPGPALRHKKTAVECPRLFKG